MSINIDIKTPHKNQIAMVLKAIADQILVTTNETVTVQLSIIFHAKEKT